MTRPPTTRSKPRIALPRLFAASIDAPRARRATDLLVLGGAAVGLGLLAVLATPTGAFERALVAVLHRIPRSLDGIWLLLASLPALLAVVLLGAALARRRISLLRDLLIAALLALGGSLALGRSVHHAWPAISEALKTGAPASWFAAPRLAVSSAIVLTASPHLSQPLRRLGRWLVITAAIVTALHGTAIPTEVAAALLVALVGTAAVHLAFGSCEGRPA
jgi:hypothetical protein